MLISRIAFSSNCKGVLKINNTFIYFSLFSFFCYCLIVLKMRNASLNHFFTFSLALHLSFLFLTSYHLYFYLAQMVHMPCRTRQSVTGYRYKWRKCFGVAIVSCAVCTCLAAHVRALYSSTALQYDVQRHTIT